MQRLNFTKIKQWIVNELWYNKNPLSLFLLPFSLVYYFVILLRRSFLELFCQQKFNVPIIVVGNLTVGGVGKTPLVIELANKFKAENLRVGIVSRGYGSDIDNYPYDLNLIESNSYVGDEPLLLAKKTNCPVVIAPKRADAVKYLIDKYQSQIIISDDGLQHYAMGRAIEIVVIDGQRGLGNGMLLPAGPLREHKSRLKQADFIVVNGTNNNLSKSNNTYRMDLIPGDIRHLISGEAIKVSTIKGIIAAVAAIGNPQRFFTTLKGLGLTFNQYPFLDHHRFSPEDLNLNEKIIVMTEKDAVKCLSIATDNMYYLPVVAKVENSFWDKLLAHKHLLIKT